MENFILYEELGRGHNSVAYKGRKKGHLSYLAIICAEKSKKWEITNHVRLSNDLDHPNIVRFYEWYETTNHLWLVVELCTGGSLQSVVAQDGGFPEDVVKRFGWDMVKGLKHIHESGIILSDLTPAKILLDGSGILKFGNFCLSKAEGETTEDMFSLLSNSVETGGGQSEINFDLMREKLQGHSSYRAPEVLQGSETSISSDLWALGCVLYYVYSGNLPFSSKCKAELTESILNQDLRPIETNPPSADFQDILKGLTAKDPEKRFGWPELLDHPFWKEIIQEENNEDVCSANLRYPSSGCSSINLPYSLMSETSVPLKTMSGSSRRTCRSETELQQSERHAFYESLKKSQDNTLELRPKSGLDENCTEPILLQSSYPSKRADFDNSDSLNKSCSLETCAPTNTTDCIKNLLHMDSELTFTPIIDNPKICKNNPVRFDHKTLCVPAHSVDKLCSLTDEEWTVFIGQICSSLEEQCSSTTSPSSTAPLQSTTIRVKLNLLCYLCCVVGHKFIANKLLNSKLLLVLTKQLRSAPNWDLRSKVLRVMGLLALHCSHLEEGSPVSEAVSTLTDLLRENLRNNKLKQFLIPPLGEFLYLICSQEEKRGSPEGLWFVPAAAYTGLMRSLREGDDPIVHHMAAKAVENIATVVSGPSHHLVTTEMGTALWFLFTHSTVEAVRVTAISSLSRLTRVDAAVFLSVLDTCGPAVVMEGIGGATARVQQHLLTALATALLTSHSQTNRIALNQDLVLKVLRCLESPSTLTRSKALLLLLLLLRENKQSLLYCCQQRLVMYLERDLRKANPLRENHIQSGYLCQCLDLLIAHLSSAAPAIMEDLLEVLRSVVGRKHPSKAQSKQLKQTLPNLSVVLDLLSSQVFRVRIVTEEFLVQIGFLLNFITSVDSNETNLAVSVGSSVAEEMIRTTLSIVEVLSQHHSHISPYHFTVVDDLLPPLTTLAFSQNVEWSVFALKVLSELCLVLLVQDNELTGGKEEESQEKKKNTNKDDGDMEKNAAGEREDGKPCCQVLSLLSSSLLSSYESLLGGTEPIPLYALKLLVSLSEHSTQFCRSIQQSGILQTIFSLILASSVTSGVVQNALALLCNLSGNTVFEQQHHEGVIEVVVNTFSETVSVYLEGERHSGGKVNHLLLQALLEILHNILKQTSVVVRAALQSQRLSYPAAETEAAEKLLVANRPLSQLSTLLIQMLPTDNQELLEESVQCLSLLVQLYGGEGQECLSSNCLKSFSQVLHIQMQAETPRILRTTLKIIKRLLQTGDRSVDSPEGAELIAALQVMTSSNRCHADVASLAAEIYQELLKS